MAQQKAFIPYRYLNDEVKGDGKIIRTRALWVSVGWHPPIIDRQYGF